MTLTIALLVLKHLYKDTFALIDTFGATCLGLVLATFVTHIVYNDTDKFFTNIEQVQTKTFIINLLQAVLFILLLIFKWVRRIVLTDNLGGQEHIIVADPEVQGEVTRLRFWARIAQAQPYAILFAIFFFVNLKLPQFCSLFWLT